MNKITYIDFKLGKQLIKDLDLKSGDYFSNTLPSELCDEYRVETGFYLNYSKQRLIKLEDTKDDNGNIVHKARIELTQETLGVDPEEPTSESILRAQTVLNKINEVLSLSIVFDDLAKE